MWHLSRDERTVGARSLCERVFTSKQTLLQTHLLCDLTNTNRPLSYKSWSEKEMSRALNAVVVDGVSVRHAALLYGVPKSTLGDRVSGKVLCGATCGRDTYLSNEEELATFIETCAAIWYAKSRKQILALVERIMYGHGIEIRVSDGWWVSFLKRHPSLTL